MAANEPGLARALQRTASLAELDGGVLAALGEALRSAPDPELYLINPFRFARERALDPAATLDVFIAAVRGGLLQFAWTMTCPGCGLFTTLMPRMAALGPRAYCALCDATHEAVLDRLVEVRFTADPSVRRLPSLDPVLLPSRGAEARARLLRYRNTAAVGCQAGPRLLGDQLLDVLVVPAGDSIDREGALLPSQRLVAVSHDVGLRLQPPRGHAGAVVRLEDTNADADADAPGGHALRLVRYLTEPLLRIESAVRGEAVLGLFELQPMLGADNQIARGYPQAHLGATVTGKVLLCNQVFRDLFANETLSAGIALQIEQVTLLFTDLKGSTALYDAIGDVRAFGLVSEHFKILLSAVRSHGGAVVKTIGDAVMGVFSEPLPALEAALQMSERLRSFNAQSGLPPLLLRIGLHCGPCIVVSSNDRLDYFGQTVNVAARVQGLADGEQIVLSDACFSAKGVAERCSSLPRHSTLAMLKGVNEPVAVHTLLGAV
jgi:class 3 adenylate cyclase